MGCPKLLQMTVCLLRASPKEKKSLLDTNCSPFQGPLRHLVQFDKINLGLQADRLIYGKISESGQTLKILRPHHDLDVSGIKHIDSLGIPSKQKVIPGETRRTRISS